MKFNLQKILIAVIIVVVLAVVVMRGDQLRELAEVVQQGAMLPLVFAVLVQLVKYFSQSLAYMFCFETVEEEMRPNATLPLVFGTFFMNTVAPSMNLAGVTLVVDDARRRGIEPGKATSAAVLMQVIVDSSFGVLMLVGFFLLFVTIGLDPLWFALALIDFAVVGVMLSLLLLGYYKPALLTKILLKVEGFVNKLLVKLKRKPASPWAERTISQFSGAAGMIGANPRSTLKAFGCCFAASCCELVAFCLVGIAFGVASPQPLVCGYVVATLFAMVSITPQGVGFVEAAVTFAFTAFGFSSAAGMAIGLVYRSIVFWLPFLVGAVMIQRTKTFKGEKASKKIEGAAAALDAVSVAGTPEPQGAARSRDVRDAQHREEPLPVGGPEGERGVFEDKEPCA